ncbi:chemotaxis protein CheA [Candidatus Symbiobacter mobilis]|uniref:Chemotaxis protein CheA n=1 Tax=Candidatus Symbiobacter mobilis CR TaxID=946483 RepID=U5N7B9_9BURK|nr:chemotaxis protein CheA [Candidatus Symbiobacter mobilis]AGX87287.1 chemotaxis histidine kinase CheA [Candidatus Symbiobacter mobilis CR]
MNPLIEQFLSESRECLQGIGARLMQLENAPEDSTLMVSLFRLVHTLKGNCGLFEYPEMTRVLHAGEDLMDQVRRGQVAYTKDLADRLLDAMDFVGMLCDEIESSGSVGAGHAADSVRLAESLRELLCNAEVTSPESPVATAPNNPATRNGSAKSHKKLLHLDQIPEAVRMQAYRSAQAGANVHWIDYSPAEDCFFHGDDPFHQARNTPGTLWGCISAQKEWPKLAEMDPYQCLLNFHLLTIASREELDEYYRYVADQIHLTPVTPLLLVIPQGDPNGGPVYDDFVFDALRLLDEGKMEGLARAVRTLLEISGPDLWLSSALRWLLLVMEFEPTNTQALRTIIQSIHTLNPPQWNDIPPAPQQNHADAHADSPQPAGLLTAEEAVAMAELVEVQRKILSLPIEENWQLGRIKSVGTTIAGFLRTLHLLEVLPSLEVAVATAINEASSAPLLTWLDSSDWVSKLSSLVQEPNTENKADPVIPAMDSIETLAFSDSTAPASTSTAALGTKSKFGRRAEDAWSDPKSLRVDQIKIDRLMNLIGEMVVSKNALPYLASRAETVFGVRDLAREIKAQYAVINRIAEEMQDAIMQVRMMPVSFVFQRFPRLVRDISRKLNKEVNLVVEGETTEADKNIIESLSDPLIHIIRNSLDHGFEQPDVRRAAGKPAAGTLTIRASQDSDHVVIEIQDDGNGIDPQIIKRKAYEKGIIDEEALDRLSDQDAINLVFASGFSTATVVSDLSGRGVGMDVVKSAIEKVNGTVILESEKGQGTRLRLSLPLSMAVTNVMIIESDRQVFGIPMDTVVETVRVPRSAIYTIKNNLATVLRGRIVPLKSLNTLLGLTAAPITNADDELAVLVIRHNKESVGLLVDDFRETVDIILKPMTGVLSGLSAYSGSALMGDGSVLMVLNVKEIF